MDLEYPTGFEFYPSPAGESNGLILVLHGRGDSAQGISFLRHGLKLEKHDYLFLNAPDPWPVPFGIPGYSWYEMAPNQGPGIERSRQLLFRVIEQLENEGYAPQQTTLLGFSQGCLMSLEIGLRAKTPFRALVGISGFVWEVEKLRISISPAVAKQTPVLITHGFNDEVLPFEETKSQVEVLKQSLEFLRFESLVKGHTIVNCEFDLIRNFILEAGRT